MAKLVSFNSYDELLSSLRNLPDNVSLPVLGARGRAEGAQQLRKVLTALTWHPPRYTNGLLIVGFTASTRGDISTFGDELTSSNFSTYFPSGGMLVI